MSINNAFAILTLGVVSSTPVVAHHGGCAVVLQQQTTITGTVTKLEWRNPHTWIYIDVKDKYGKVTNWGVHLGAPSALASRTPPVTFYTFKLGDQLTVSGNPATNGMPRLGECPEPPIDIVAHTPASSKPKP
jgi:hypothetical protein